MIKNLDKIAREIRADRYERTPAGIYFPRRREILQGVVEWRGKRGLNIMTNETIALLAADTFPTTFYMALWEDNVVPLQTWTGATFAAAAGEITSTADGYVEATRPVLADINGVDPAEFNMRSTGSPVTVYGIAILDGDTRGGTGDALIAAKRFPTAPELFDDQDIFDVRYSFGVAPA